jgi:holliday junction DNA helicase RuvA
VIGSLTGTLASKHPPHLTVDCGGVGYEVEAPMSTCFVLPAVGAKLTLLTHLVVREDAQLLYGFATEAERRLFRALIKVNGVGPKLALTVLSGASVDDFARCIRDGDASQLTRLPGVGKKTAERLIIEMRDRLDIEPAPGGAATPGKPGEEALAALVALGYKPNDAAAMVREAQRDGGDTTTEDLLRRALSRALHRRG